MTYCWEKIVRGELNFYDSLKLTDTTHRRIAFYRTSDIDHYFLKFKSSFPYTPLSTLILSETGFYRICRLLYSLNRKYALAPYGSRKSCRSRRSACKRVSPHREKNAIAVIKCLRVTNRRSRLISQGISARHACVIACTQNRSVLRQCVGITTMIIIELSKTLIFIYADLYRCILFSINLQSLPKIESIQFPI